MLKKVSLTAIIVLIIGFAYAQNGVKEEAKPVGVSDPGKTQQSKPEDEEKSPFALSGSVDAYYRYNFHNVDDGWHSNNYTSFTNSQNSFELGMASLKGEYSKGKVTAVADLGFGKRAEEFAYADNATLLAVKQAYVSYAPSDKVKFTMGKWATHVGYELLDPQLNRNYSMSYMFSYGPFSHTGIKADITASEHIGIMLGVANPTDMTTADFSRKFVLAQLSGTFDKASFFLNYVGGSPASDVTAHQVGLTATATVSDQFGLGYDGTVKFVNAFGTKGSWWGSALYLNFDPSSVFGITVRGEYFGDKDAVAGFGTNIFDATLSFNIKPVENIMIIPEFRLDGAKDEIFTKNDGSFTKGSGQFILAAVVSF